MTSHETAVLIWQVLIAAAFGRQTVSDGELGERIGVAADDLGGPLGQLARCCALNGWPALTTLVLGPAAVNSGKDASGPRFLGAEREAVFQHHWFRMIPLSVAALEEAEKPPKRPCPRCGREGNAAARLCGYCWLKLTPAAPLPEPAVRR